MVFPSNASWITTTKARIPPCTVNIGLLHGEESSKAASLAVSNVRFKVMLGSPVPLPCHPWACGHRFWCKGSNDFIEKLGEQTFWVPRLEILHLHGLGFGSWFGRFFEMQKYYVYSAFLNCRGPGDRKEKHWNIHKISCFAASGSFFLCRNSNFIIAITESTGFIVKKWIVQVFKSTCFIVFTVFNYDMFRPICFFFA